jgi:hypothetical protein
MGTRMTAVAAAIVAVLTLAAGVALAESRAPGGWVDHDQMHASEQMGAMHAQMPAGAQAECEAAHAQMSSQMGPMMGQMHGWGGMGQAPREWSADR